MTHGRKRRTEQEHEEQTLGDIIRALRQTVAEGFCAIHERLDRLSEGQSIIFNQGETNMALVFEGLAAAVAKAEGAGPSTQVFIDGLLAEIATLKTQMADPADQAKIDEFTRRLEAITPAIVAAVPANSSMRGVDE